MTSWSGMTLQMNLTSVLKFDVNVKSRPPVRDTLAMSCESPVCRYAILYLRIKNIPADTSSTCMRQWECRSFLLHSQSNHMWIWALHGPWTLVLWLRGARRTIWHFTKFISYLSDTDYDQNLIRPTCKIALITQCGGALRDWNTPGARKTVDSGVWDLSRVTGTL